MVNKIKRKDFILVGVQFILLTIFFTPFFKISFQSIVFLKYPGAVISITGFLVILISVFQLNKNLTPFPTPIFNGNLIKTGLYKYIRHPIYSGIFLATIGLGFFNNSLWQICIAVTLLILFYFKSSYEENLLNEKYEEYKKYKETTNRFFPFLD